MPLVDDVQAGVTLLSWVTVGDAGVCDDCDALGRTAPQSLDSWERRAGLPGSGQTACRGNCRCVMIPEGVLGTDFDVIDPVLIRPILDGEFDRDDLVSAEERMRLAANARLLSDFAVGTYARYNGPVRQFAGSRVVVTEISRDGATIRFAPPLSQFPEFQELRVLELNDLVPIRGE